MRWRKVSGVTLIELITVLLLVGILAVFAAPRLQIGGFQQYAFERDLKNALRQAQKVAIGSGCHVEVTLTGGGGYSVGYTGDSDAEDNDGDCQGTLRHPSRGGAFEGTPEGGSGVAPGSGGAVKFKGRGQVENGKTIDLIGGGRITVEAETGYIHDS